MHLKEIFRVLEKCTLWVVWDIERMIVLKYYCRLEYICQFKISKNTSLKKHSKMDFLNYI